jgi:3-deoxy-manno-octulosonate cytidylyltransferase (CMP-KDO synthetase)
MPDALAIIPARFASVRFPGKPLADRTGKPLIQHVAERVRLATRIRRVVVATDDQRIFDAVEDFGGEVVMTGEHPNGTSRLTEAVERIDPHMPDDAIIVNVQGDEPEIPPQTIDALVEGIASAGDAPMATLASPFGPDENPDDPNIVKIVIDRRGRAIYFSRSRIPFDRDAALRGERSTLPVYKHPGLYAYRRGFLRLYPTLDPTPLEQAEKLEQLRVLEHGHTIHIVHADAPRPGIDTPEQYEAFLERCHSGVG